MSVLYIKDKNGNFVPVPFIKTNGGADPDWNAVEGEPGHVKNRTHYSEFSNVIFPETVVAWDETTEYAGIMELAEPLVLGNSYKVEYNGAEFALDARDYEGVGIYLGNKSFLGDTFEEENTGEPFVIAYVEGTVMLIGFNMQTGEPAAGSATVKIIAETVHKIPEKYLPDMRPYYVVIAKDGDSYVCADTPAKVKAAYDSGRQLICKESVDSFGGFMFYQLGAFSPNGPMYYFSAGKTEIYLSSTDGETFNVDVSTTT